MAQAHVEPPPRAPWTKIFTAFKVALDLKKLLLAAAGILIVSVGWWFLGWAFYSVRSFPVWIIDFKEKRDPAELQTQWSRFRADRASWNLLHELAGSPTDHKALDAGDVAESLDEYLLLNEWEKPYRRLSEPIFVKGNKLEVPRLDANQKVFTLSAPPENAGALNKLKDKVLTLQSLHIDAKADKLITIDGIPVKVDDGNIEELRRYREGALDAGQIAAKAANEENQKVAQKALQTFKTHLQQAKIKPSGLLCNWPWFEYRGSNPYLIVSNTIKTGVTPDARASVFHWLIREQLPVLLEPLYKFLTPLVYLFDQRAGFLDRCYLTLVILWTVTIWGFFGGAICRIAAVQVARNERISMKEAILFTKERFLSYVAAPVFPMTLLAILGICLVVFGWFAWIPYVGEILVAGLFWPVVLIIGFIMAIVMVGLIAWPLMTATISTEGSDAFDALSRSYSYLYQAPWQLLWYSFLAVVYGAVLVFFVGFMASLFVFMGKWGVGSAPFVASIDPARDREPSYLFYYAPTSFGWRDLLISSNQDWVEARETILPSGETLATLEFKEEYKKHLSGVNHLGAGLVAFWIWLLFLLVIGFGYSYFWSVSTIIYFLMRRYVDDTEMEEVYVEDDEIDAGFAPLAPKPATEAAPPASKPGVMSLNVVEAPPPAAPPRQTGIAAGLPTEPPNNPPPQGNA